MILSTSNYPGYLRTSHNDKVQGATAAQFVWEYLGITTAATIHDGSLYSNYMQQAFTDEFTNLGGTITAQKIIDPGQTDMSTVLTSIAAGAPQLLYFPVFMPAGGYIISQARATAGLESAYLMGADGLWTEDIVTATGEDVEGFMVTSPDFTKFSAAYTNIFLPAYRARFGDPISIFHAHAYDAFMLIKAAIEKVAVVDGGSIMIGRQALRDAMYGTKNFPGLTGNLTCSATGDCADPHIAVYKYHTGQFPPVYIWPTSFTDVPFNYWASSWIERLYRAGITAGCATTPNLLYCPENPVTRAQMAIFLERGIRGSAYIPPAATGTVFTDVPISHWAAAWIEKLAVDGITTGCGGGNYCPEDNVTRAQMAIFLLRAKHGAAYVPPPVGGTTGFADVPINNWAAAWIKQLAAEAITSGCGGGNYCPDNNVTRAEMAVFLVRTFNLP